MAVYARVIGGVLVYVGPLPVRAVRLDTFEIVDPSSRLAACGFHDVATFNAATIPNLSVEQREALTAEVAAAVQRRASRSNLVDRVAELANLARDANWDWIDAFGHPDLLTIPFVSGQSPNAGASWGAPTAAVAADRLRLAVSLCLVENIRLAQAITLVFEALSDDLDAADVDAPPAR